MAWEAFEQKNGVPTLHELRERVRKYRRNDDALDPVIGCNILSEPFFFARSDWIPIPSDWASNIVSGKSYQADTGEGEKLWAAVQKRLQVYDKVNDPSGIEDDEQRRFGEEYLVRGRLGQGAFRVLVTDAYQRRCAVTGEKTLPVLEAAHIRPFSMRGPHRVSNGLLLRSDLHKLFDLGYVTVTDDHKLEVSSRLRQEWQNGKIYYAHHGLPLQFLPQDLASLPGKEFLRWHNENVFKS